jgi:hypothetical protein
MGRFSGWKAAVIVAVLIVGGVFVSIVFRVHGTHSGSLSSLMVPTPLGARECSGVPTGSLSQSQITTLVGTAGNPQGDGFDSGYASCWELADGSQVTAVIVRFVSSEFALLFVDPIVNGPFPAGGSKQQLAHGATIVDPPVGTSVTSTTIVSKGDTMAYVIEKQPPPANASAAQTIASAIYQEL